LASINTSELFGRGANATFDYTVRGLNVASGYLLMDFVLISVFIIMLFTLRNYELRDGLLSASTVVWVISIVMWISGLVDFTRVVIAFCSLIIAIGMSYFKE